jgi:hypothetical protein
MPRARNGVLGHHALPGFDIAKKEILLAVVTKLGASREQRREHGISRRLDIDGGRGRVTGGSRQRTGQRSFFTLHV